MFRHEGKTRENRHDRWLAGTLATVAGFVNAAGFVLAGAFTSHASGNVSRAADDLASGKALSTESAASLVVAFFAGAFVASLAIEGRSPKRLPSTYGVLLLFEAALIGVFVVRSEAALDRAVGGGAGGTLLCLAMGLQNSLVTRLSGAVVRTTHVTGVITDLGIEAARWFRYVRAVFLRGRYDDAAAVERPHVPKIVLLTTIFTAFFIGSGIGAIAATRIHARAMVFPLVMLVVGGIYAFASGRSWGGALTRK